MRIPYPHVTYAYPDWIDLYTYTRLYLMHDGTKWYSGWKDESGSYMSPEVLRNPPDVLSVSPIRLSFPDTAITEYCGTLIDAHTTDLIYPTYAWINEYGGQRSLVHVHAVGRFMMEVEYYVRQTGTWWRGVVTKLNFGKNYTPAEYIDWIEWKLLY